MKTNKLILLLFSVFFFNYAFNQKSVHDFTVNDIKGKAVKLSNYKGKVLLIVNTASKCGYTPQYKELEAFYTENKSKGFEILGFPANNFMGQEPGTNEEIQQFCSTKFNVTFPMFSKISVKGKDMAPLYKYLTKKTENGKLDASVKWNFQKFLVDKNGKVLACFYPGQKVTDEDVNKAILDALK